MHAMKSLFACLALLWGLASCVSTQPASPWSIPSEFIAPDPGPQEGVVQVLPLAGPLSKPEAEISGMAWYGDVLVLLPQYPHRWNHSLYGLHRSDLEEAIEGASDFKLEPFPIPLAGSAGMGQLEGYEGLEAIAFGDDTVYFLAEANMKTHMQGYLLSGTVKADLSRIELNLENVIVLAPQTRIMNQSYEAMVLSPNGIASFFEANGAEVNLAPEVLLHDVDLNPLATLKMPAIEYRLTDATTVNMSGEFWMFNFHWPGSKRLMPLVDPIAERWGEGPSQSQTDIVERILKFRIAGATVELVDEPPLELQLLNSTVARNWEGIVLWKDEGFLLVTDKFPTTSLAFVAR